MVQERILALLKFGWRDHVGEFVRGREKGISPNNWGRNGRKTGLDQVNHPEQETRLQREIDVTDHQIDQLVYELYGLTEEEIRGVEERAP